MSDSEGGTRGGTSAVKSQIASPLLVVAADERSVFRAG
jgi:hypothetical protein